MSFSFIQITENELKDFSSILQEAAVWMKNKGEEMWDIEQLSIHHLLQSYRLNEMYLGYIDVHSAGTIVLQEEDQIFWPEFKGVNNSLFIHKLSIRREFAKSGLSTEMISWAKSQAAERQKNYLRLDCAADRIKLCNFYEKEGFYKVDEKVMFGKYPTAFYELIIPPHP